MDGCLWVSIHILGKRRQLSSSRALRARSTAMHVPWRPLMNFSHVCGLVGEGRDTSMGQQGHVCLAGALFIPWLMAFATPGPCACPPWNGAP